MTKRLPVEPTWLTESTVLAVHALQVERYGGRHGVRDESLLYSLITKPRQRWNYDEHADLPWLAATYMSGLGRADVFFSGNKRTALACTLLFLSLNDADVSATGIELLSATLAIATHTMSDSDTVGFFRANVRV